MEPPDNLIMIGEKNRRREWFCGTTLELVQRIGPSSGLLVPQFASKPKNYCHSRESDRQNWTSSVHPHFIRYCGIWDLDVPTSALERIAAGEVALVKGQKAQPYTSIKAVKEALTTHYVSMKRQCPAMTLRELFATVPILQRLATIAEEMAQCLTNGFAMFTGGKGFHVIGRDRSLFRFVVSEDRFDLALFTIKKQLLQRRRSTWTFTPTDEDTDPAIDRRNAGIAMRAWSQRKTTGIWPCLIHGCGATQDNPAFVAHADTTLQDAMVSFIEWMRAACPHVDPQTVLRASSGQKRKRAKTKARLPNTAEQNVCSAWRERHGLLAVRDMHIKRWGCVELVFSLQTQDSPNEEYSPSIETRERVYHEHSLEYLHYRQCKDAARQTQLYQQLLPLHESFKALPNYRFAADIDNALLTSADFGILCKAMQRVAGEAAQSMVVCASTNASADGRKWHVTYSSLVLPREWLPTACQLLRAELQADAAWQHDVDNLIDEAPWKGYLRAPGSPKASATEPGCYEPRYVWQNTHLTVCDDLWYDNVTPEQFAKVVRDAYIIAPENQPLANAPRIFSAYAQNKQRTREEHEKRSQVPAQKQTTLPRCFSGSPRGFAVIVSPELPLLSDAYCRAAVIAYLSHARNSCPADQVPLENDLNVLQQSSTFICVTKNSQPHCWCQVAGREHSNCTLTKILWYVAVPEQGGRPRVGQICHSDKCKGLASEQRAARAPSATIVQPGITNLGGL